MDLTARLLRFGAGRPHALVVPAVGGTAARLAVESELARRGWPSAPCPADADLLVVAGPPGPQLGGVVEALLRQMPAPRARADVVEPAGVARALDAAVAVLADPLRQRTVAKPVRRPDRAGDPERPAGLPMADVGEDRDGLRLDRLDVALGPALPDWPAGLVIHVTLQGDVVQEASVEVLDGTHADPFWEGERVAARELDALGRFLAVAGWDDAAARARRLRDELLAGRAPERVGAGVRGLVRRVRRSRTLRWLVAGVGAGAGDVSALLERRLAALERFCRAGSAELPDGERGGTAEVPDGERGGTVEVPDGERGGTAEVPDGERGGTAELPALLAGTELAALRLVVAAVDPDPGAEIAARSAKPPFTGRCGASRGDRGTGGAARG